MKANKDVLAALSRNNPVTQILQQATTSQASTAAATLPSVDSQYGLEETELEVRSAATTAATPPQQTTTTVGSGTPIQYTASITSVHEAPDPSVAERKKELHKQLHAETRMRERRERAQRQHESQQQEQAERRLAEEREYARLRNEEEAARRDRQRREDEERREAQRREDEHRAQLQREAAARIEQQKRAAYITVKATERASFISLGRAQKLQATHTSNYDLAIQSFQSALAVDLHYPGDKISLSPTSVFKDLDVPAILFEIAECHLLKGDIETAYQHLQSLQSKIAEFNSSNSTHHALTETIDNNLAASKAKILAKGYDHLANAQRLLYHDKNIVEAGIKLDNARACFDIIKHNDDNADIQKLKEAIAWLKGSAQVNLQAVQLITKARNAVLGVNITGIEYCTCLQQDLNAVIGIYRTYQAHLNTQEFENYQTLQGLLPLVTSRLNYLHLLHNWHKTRDRINAAFTRHNELNEKSLESINDFRPILDDLRECQSKYAKYKECLSRQEAENAANIEKLLAIAERGFKMQVAREQREADRIRNVQLEAQINQLIVVLTRNLQVSDSPQALQNLTLISQLAANINYAEDIANHDILHADYFAASIAKLTREAGYFNMRAKNNAESMIRNIIATALMQRPKGYEPIISKGDSDTLTKGLQTMLQRYWVKFDRRSIDDYQAIIRDLAQVINNNLRGNWFLTRWVSGTHLYLNDVPSLCKRLEDLLAAYTPTNYPDPITIDILQAQVVAPPPTAAVAVANVAADDNADAPMAVPIGDINGLRTTPVRTGVGVYL
jgi:hypothetical protein